jgi:hypothetical protein
VALSAVAVGELTGRAGAGEVGVVLALVRENLHATEGPQVRVARAFAELAKACDSNAVAAQRQVNLASSTVRIAAYSNSSATANSGSYRQRALTSDPAASRELHAGSSGVATFVLPRRHVSEVSALKRCEVGSPLADQSDLIARPT